MAAPLALAGGAIAKKYLAGKGVSALGQRMGGAAVQAGVSHVMQNRKTGPKTPGLGGL